MDQLTFALSLRKRFCHGMNCFPCFWKTNFGSFILEGRHPFSMFILTVISLLKEY